MLQRYLDWGQAVRTLDDLRTLPPEGILARCLFGEARASTVSADERGKVGCVIRNRGKWWVPKNQLTLRSWVGIILQPKQFSWTLTSDPNYLKVLDPMKAELPAVWEGCCIIAEGVVKGTIADTTSNADHYYDKSMDRHPPYWAASMKPTVRTEHYRFFRSDRVKV